MTHMLPTIKDAAKNLGIGMAIGFVASGIAFALLLAIITVF